MEDWIITHKARETTFSTNCQCLGESCTNIGTVLFKIGSFHRLVRKHTSSIEIACRWNKSAMNETETNSRKEKLNSKVNVAEDCVNIFKPLQPSDVNLHKLKEINETASFCS